MATIEITSDNFKSEVLESDKPVVLDFWAVWCGPCQMVSPLVEQLSDEHPEIKFGKVNTDEQQALAGQFGITAIPTLIKFDGGKPVAQQTGALPKDKLEAWALK